MSDSFDPIVAARLLREISAEIRTTEGAERNGLFLELHRLHDTIFRLALESHPDLPVELQGSAFNLHEPLPAPQVVRELNRLGSPLANKEIRNLYKHMNMARNTMAHDSVIERVTISNSNMKRMAELAIRVADVLDPHAQSHPDFTTSPPLSPFSRARLNLILGILLGAVMVGGWMLTINPFIPIGVTLVFLTVGGAVWLFSD